MNMKYLTATQQLNLSGFSFVKEYEKCTICFPQIPDLAKAYGPFLYENDEFLPRAYITNGSILVVGNKGSLAEQGTAVNLMYGLMLQDQFDPKHTVIVLGDKEKINDYAPDFLKHFQAVVLAQGSFDQNSGAILDSYARAGGKIYPNLLEKKSSITNEDIEGLFNISRGSFIPVSDEDISASDFDHKTIKLPQQEGFLVLSEKYTLYQGWTANPNVPLYRANGVITAVPLHQNYEKIDFAFKPKSFVIGSWISTVTLILVVIILGYYGYQRKTTENIEKALD